jgi:hypothetical protein
MISFDRLEYSKIPISENKLRVEYLTLLRNLILDAIVFSGGAEPVVALSPTTGQPLNQEQRRTEINERKPLALQMIRLAGIKTQRDCATRLKEITSSRNLDVIEQLWSLESFGVSFREPIDVIEEAIGKYKRDQKKALGRTRNPVFWILRIVGWIAGVPFWLISLLGFSREKAEESQSGQLAKGLIEIGPLVSGFGWLVQLLVNLIQLLHDFGWTKILHRFGFN